MSASAYLIDTNILLRLARRIDSQHEQVQFAVDELTRQGSTLHFSLQNVAEFWNVCTRPIDRNGFGLSNEEMVLSVAAIELRMSLLADNAAVYWTWRRLVDTHQVRGVQVHDARLAALMEVHGVTHLLTLNQADFARYPAVRAVHPREVVGQGTSTSG